MATANLGQLVSTVLRERRREIADNVLQHNALLRFLNQRGNADPVDGGRTLVEPLEYAENSTFKYYSGYEVLDTTPVDIIDAAEYEWKQAAVVVSMSGLERRRASGRNALVNLLNTKIRNAEKTMQNNLSDGVYSDGTGTSGKQIGGLQSLVADAPSTGTVGGINRANFSFWQNSVTDVTTDTGSAASSTTIPLAMNDLWLKVLRGTDRPDIIVAGSTYFDYYWQSLTSIQRITSSTEAAQGFRSIEFNGPGGNAPVMYDPDCSATRMYMLNTDYLYWRPHRDANIEPLTQRDSFNQDAFVVPVIFMGNLTMSNAARQGVIKD